MKKIIKEIPDNIRYLSEWEDFYSLPQQEHYILSKEICGCGATEAFIKSKVPLIVVMPRKHLLFNKYSQHTNDNVFLYRFLDQRQYFSDKTPTSEELKEYDRLFINYVNNGGNTILATYDALSKIVKLLHREGVDHNIFKVVVDEFQQIIGDAPFKSSIEHQFYEALKKFKSVVYVSATPFLDEYLEMTEQFRDLPVIQLKWPAKSVKRADVRSFKLNKSITEKCCEIIRNYQSGDTPYCVVGNKRVESHEAVFFLNDVKTIINVIKKARLVPEEVNILCAPRKENYDRINSLNKGRTDEQTKFSKGDIPGKGDQHKMFTFCTSTVYIGSDFYSTNAYTFIFANPNVESLTIDVSTDLQQIIGRQRLEENPFRNKADLYYFLKKPLVTKEEMETKIKAKQTETVKHIENYENAKHKDSQLKSIEALISQGHSDQYCCISEDERGNKTIVENSLIPIAEKRAWDIANTIYTGDFSLFKALEKSVNIIREVDTTNPEVKKVFEEWNKDCQFKRRAMLYCDLKDSKNDLLSMCNFIPKHFHDYHEALGRKGMEVLNWRADYIREALAPIPDDLFPYEQIATMLKAKFREGCEYTKEEIKQELLAIYSKLNIRGKPSALEIQQFFTIKESSKRIDRRKVATIRVISHWRKRISLFQTIASVKKPIESVIIDEVLDMIKTGGRFNLKKRVAELRSTVDKESFDEKKSRLPVATWNGMFDYRDASGCSCYSSFTALDFDHVEDVEDLQKWLRTFPCVYAYFKSPSGHGIKAIILHDNLRSGLHRDLYEQLLSLFRHREPDPSTSDLGRGNYISYDPDLWINHTVTPYHYEPSPDPITKDSVRTQLVIRSDIGDEMIEDIDDPIVQFLNYLNQTVLSDESIINMLNSRWNQATLARGRNNSALSYAGVLCKAGVEKNKAREFIATLIPDLPKPELTKAVNYAYEHNNFGSHRRCYLKHRTPR